MQDTAQLNFVVVDLHVRHPLPRDTESLDSVSQDRAARAALLARVEVPPVGVDERLAHLLELRLGLLAELVAVKHVSYA